MFSLFLVLHIASGALCLIVGLVAGLAKKKKGLHTIVGEVYHGSYVVVFVTALIMSIWHWSESAYLFYIALFSYGLALTGYIAGKLKKKNWLVVHISGMLGSYIGILTATLVVNAHRIPVINEIPDILIWILPTIIGSPLIAMVNAKYVKKRKKQASIPIKNT